MAWVAWASLIASACLFLAQLAIPPSLDTPTPPHPGPTTLLSSASSRPGEQSHAATAPPKTGEESCQSCAAAFGRATGGELWAIGIWSSGVFLGFLFGIPRAKAETVVTPRTPGAPAETSQTTLSVNTNLEQISDWLTKILVGVGLTQLRTLPDRISAAAHFMSDRTCAFACPPIAAAAIVVFVPLGFLFGYLATRLYISSAFSRADQSLNTGLPSVSASGPNEKTGGDSQPDAAASATASTPTRPPALPADVVPQYRAATAERDAGAYGPAANKFIETLSRVPTDPLLIRESLWVLFKRGPEWSDQIADLLSRLAALREVASPNDRPLVYLSLTFHYLYNEQHGGYEEVIRYATEYIEGHKGRPGSGIYINLACAYGQKYRSSPNADRIQLSNLAAQAINEALKLEPTTAPRIAKLLAGLPPDDDLSEIVKDPTFRQKVNL